MIVSIHQPQYLPWLGYFDKINKSDVFVLLDNVQFKKNEWQNRNRIKNSCDWQWITVPVLHNFGQLINEVKINNKIRWKENHLKTLKLNYSKANYFNEYIGEIEKIYIQDWELLSDLNIHLIYLVCKFLGIKTKIVKSSEYITSTNPTGRLIDLCKIFNADTYLSGIDGPKYMEIGLFEKNSVKLMTQNYKHPQYPQISSTKNNCNFLSHMSVIDLLFNCGASSLNILNNKEGEHSK